MNFWIIDVDRGCGAVAPVVILWLVQMIIVRDRTHRRAKQQNPCKPGGAARRPNRLLFHNGSGKSDRAPSHAHDAYQLDIPRHQIQCIAADLPPQTDDRDYRNEKFKAVNQS